MKRLTARFDALRAAGRKALVPFVTAGDPSLQATVPVLHALVGAGADAIELGVPFSEPMAEGPTIQRSSERALGRGAGLSYVLECVRAFRERDGDTPLVLMGYLNPVEIRGYVRFAEEASAAGVDGLLLVDLPPEEADECRAALSAQGIALIQLASPTTSDERLRALCADVQGYLYYVSFAGVTGADRLDIGLASERLQRIRAMSAAPVLAGFGIKDAASAAAMGRAADGVIVGSALVAALAEAADVPEAAGRFLAPLRAALDTL
jgi:tryptophan synthase alpha chain